MVESTEMKRARMAAARQVRLAKLEARKKELQQKDFEDLPHNEPIIGTGWEGDDGPQMAGSAQHVVLYSTKDGVASKVRIEQMVNLLMPDAGGTINFSDKPTNPAWKYKQDPTTGVPIRLPDTPLLCRLHPDHPDRAWLDEIGLGSVTCTKDNLPSRFQVDRHMASRHPVTWATIQREEENRRRDEDRERQERMMEALSRR